MAWKRASLVVPPTLAHLLEQIRFLLISSVKIIPRKFVLRIVLHTLLALRNVVVNDFEVLLERNVYCRIRLTQRGNCVKFEIAKVGFNRRGGSLISANPVRADIGIVNSIAKHETAGR